MHLGPPRPPWFVTGFSDQERERTFRARHPSEFVRAAQAALARATAAPPTTILKGRWAFNSNTSTGSGNFVYTIAGVLSPSEIMALSAPLCDAFQGTQTALVPREA